MNQEVKEERKLPSFRSAVSILLIIAVFIAVGMLAFKLQLQTMMFYSWLIIAVYAWYQGIPFSELEKKSYDSVRAALPVCMILLGTGALVATWINAGTVSTLIYVGLKACSPRFFLLITFLLTAVTSLVTGTSWGTIGTVGLAMMGIGAGLSLPEGMTAGAIISGAFFGDRLSPVSDSTNMAAAVSGTSVMSHVKSMLYTTAPSMAISVVIFLILGLWQGNGKMDEQVLKEMLDSISASMKISWITLLPVVLFLFLIIRKTSALLALMISSAAGFLVSVLYQGMGISSSAQALYQGVTIDFGSEMINSLLQRGGMSSMLGTVALMMIAMSLGGLLQASGILQVIVQTLTKKIKKETGMIFATMASVYMGHILVGSGSFAMVTTGMIFKPMYQKFGIKTNVLSRIIEDCGSMCAPLIPWNVNAAYCIEMLQVPWSAYFPFCFFNHLTPIISVIYVLAGYAIFRADDEDKQE